MAPVAAGVLGVGMMVIAFVVFGPARRRLLAVQDATERLGAGDLDARAPDNGGDEVAAVARSFNKMAVELASRARALEASDNARRQLLADVSHELMTPLTAMRGYIETLGMSELKLDAAHSRTLPAHRHRRDASTRAHHRRPARPRAPRRRRHVDASRARGREGDLRRAWPRDMNANCRSDGVRLVQRVEPGAEVSRRRPGSSRAGAAEPGRERAATHAGGRRDRPE